MAMRSRLNILLTHGQAGLPAAYPESQPWYQALAHLLTPLGVRTFEATSGSAALQLIEQHPIHLAVVDTRLSTTDAMAVLRVIQRIRQRAQAADYAASLPAADEPQVPPPQGPAFRVRVQVEGPEGTPPRHVEVRFGPAETPSTVWPTVILVTPSRDMALMQEALKFNAFSVMSEPVDLNLMLDVMARAMRRFHHNLWPQ